MDIRFTDRWGGLSYKELYCILDGLIGIIDYGTSTCDPKFVYNLIREINQELIKRQKEGAAYEL